MDDPLVNRMTAVMAGPDSLGRYLRGARVNLDLDRTYAPSVTKVCITLERVLVPWLTLGMLIMGLHHKILFLVVSRFHEVGSSLDQFTDDHRRSRGRSRSGIRHA